MKAAHAAAGKNAQRRSGHCACWAIAVPELARVELAIFAAHVRAPGLARK
jgi:hypothetical protein